MVTRVAWWVGGVPRHALIGSDYICDHQNGVRQRERELVCVRVFLYINKYIALKKNIYARPFLFHKKHKLIDSSRKRGADFQDAVVQLTI